MSPLILTTTPNVLLLFHFIREEMSFELRKGEVTSPNRQQVSGFELWICTLMCLASEPQLCRSPPSFFVPTALWIAFANPPLLSK